MYAATRDGGLEVLILMASVSVLVSAAHVSVLVSEVPASSTGSREPASVSKPASRPSLDGLGLGLGLGCRVSVLVSEVLASTTTLFGILSEGNEHQNLKILRAPYFFSESSMAYLVRHGKKCQQNTIINPWNAVVEEKELNAPKDET